jgi:hypothetical protein
LKKFCGLRLIKIASELFARLFDEIIEAAKLRNGENEERDRDENGKSRQSVEEVVACSFIGISLKNFFLSFSLHHLVTQT